MATLLVLAIGRMPASPAPSPAPTMPPPDLPAAGSADATPTPAPEGPRFYNMVDDIDEPTSINRTATLYYYFQGNTNGTAKVKQEVRYGRNLWNNDAIVRLRIPFITRYPTSGNPFSGLGNIELGYAYNVAASSFDHSLEFRVALPTATNGVESLDTQLKGFYTTKWQWRGGAAIYVNEYDQSIIVPPGSSWTSYYEGKLTLPNSSFIHPLGGLRIAAIYDFRVLFNSGGAYKNAIGGTLFGNLNDVAISFTDTWGLGSNPLWKFKPEVNVTAKF